MKVGRWEMADGRWEMGNGSAKLGVGRWKMGAEISKLFVLKNSAIAQIAVKILFVFAAKNKKIATQSWIKLLKINESKSIRY